MKRAIIFAGLLLCCMYPATLLGKDKKTGDKVEELAANEAQLVVSADGKTKEEATKSALRSAIEQVCGVFVSSDTEILNDEIVNDEVVTISSGNIREYKELACETLSNGNVSVTLQAIVNVSKIISYVQNKGVTTEFAGATFAMNMQMYELNKRNEEIAIKNMCRQVKELFPQIFTYTFVVGTPKMTRDQTAFELPLNVNVVLNKENMDVIYRLIQSTLYHLSLSKSEFDNCNVMKIPLKRMHIDAVLPRPKLVFGKSGMAENLKNKAKENGYLYFRTNIPSIYHEFRDTELYPMLLNFEVIGNTGQRWTEYSTNFKKTDWTIYYQIPTYSRYNAGQWFGSHSMDDDMFKGNRPTFYPGVDIERYQFVKKITVSKDGIGKYSSFEVRKHDTNNVQQKNEEQNKQRDFKGNSLDERQQWWK